MDTDTQAVEAAIRSRNRAYAAAFLVFVIVTAMVSRTFFARNQALVDVTNALKRSEARCLEDEKALVATQEALRQTQEALRKTQAPR